MEGIINSQEGFYENFFHLLTIPDAISRQIPQVNIPDTIIIKSRQILSWYISLKGGVYKKHKEKKTFQNILDKFLENIPQCGIVAVWIEKIQMQHQKEKIIYSYFTEKDLRQWVDQFQNTYDFRYGILQKFIQPKSQHHEVLLTNWSPEYCLFEKIQNKNKLSDKYKDIYQKLPTYESEVISAQCTQHLHGKALCQRLETMSHNIATHFFNISQGRYKISRFKLIFKLGANNKLYLIGCQEFVNMYLRQNQPQKIQQNISQDGSQASSKNNVDENNISEQQISDRDYYEKPKYYHRVKKLNTIVTEFPSDVNVDNILSMNKKNISKLEDSCQQCEKKCASQQLVDVQIKNIIKSWEQDHCGQISTKNLLFKSYSTQKNVSQQQNIVQKRDLIKDMQLQKPNQVGQILELGKGTEIPPFFYNIFPKMKLEYYNKLKFNPTFLEKELKLCESCYITVITEQGLDKCPDKIQKNITYLPEFKGTKPLNPTVLREKYQDTQQRIQSKQFNDQLKEQTLQDDFDYKYSNNSENQSQFTCQQSLMHRTFSNQQQQQLSNQSKSQQNFNIQRNKLFQTMQSPKKANQKLINSKTQSTLDKIGLKQNQLHKNFIEKIDKRLETLQQNDQIAEQEFQQQKTQEEEQDFNKQNKNYNNNCKEPVKFINTNQKQYFQSSFLHNTYETTDASINDSNFIQNSKFKNNYLNTQESIQDIEKNYSLQNIMFKSSKQFQKKQRNQNHKLEHILLQQKNNDQKNYFVQKYNITHVKGSQTMCNLNKIQKQNDKSCDDYKMDQNFQSPKSSQVHKSISTNFISYNSPRLENQLENHNQSLMQQQQQKNNYSSIKDNNKKKKQNSFNNKKMSLPQLQNKI